MTLVIALATQAGDCRRGTELWDNIIMLRMWLATVVGFSALFLVAIVVV